MGNRIREEEKNERIIRSLLKLPENKRCINCNSLGPQYVCTTFLTFVCTNCSGVHREFTHRVKSVSMAKFTTEEVNSLQAGGNERARQLYFKEFDPQYHSFPDASNVGRLRDFIKHVYVDRKYTGEKGVQKLPKLRLSEEPDERRRVGAYQGGSRSFHDEEKKFGTYYGGPRRFRDEEQKAAAPYGGSRSFRDEDWKIAAPSGGSRSFRDQDWKVALPYSASRSFHDHENRSERHYTQGSSPSVRGADQNVVKYYYDERKRSPRYSEQNSRSGGTGFRKTPVRFEVVDNRIRDDRKVRSGLATPKSQNRSPENNNTNSFSTPAVRSVQEIQGVKILPPQFHECSMTIDRKNGDGSADIRKMKSISTGDGNAVEHKKETLATLIDLNTDPEPSDDAVKSPQQQTPPPDNGNNWASFDSCTKEKAPPVPKPDTLEALLLELTPASVYTTATATATEAPSNDDAPSTMCTNNINAGAAAPDAPVGQMLSLFDTISACTSASTTTSVLVLPSNADPLQAAPTSGVETPVTVSDVQQSPSTQHDQSSISFAANSSSSSQLAITHVEASNNLSRTPSFAQNTQGSPKTSQSMLRTQSLPVETKSSKREELPVDLFAAHYSTIPSQASGWPPGPPQGMRFNMQYYPNIAPAPAFLGSRTPTNPFDIYDDKTLGHLTHFPSMSSLEGALHNVSVPPSLVHTHSLGSFPSYSQPSYAAFSPGPYTGEQLHNNAQFLRPPGIGGLSQDEASALGTLSSSQQLSFQQPSSTYPAPSHFEPFSSTGGNPFG
ncbi:probable ADP-ribosylation factor GTPase-activating protein AGD14 [Argentina anserina]|uniref:probable ADP-ribosylation factor GTPase-activating protein AGD14 n=1 Tax=Argentina anserina TaxID=57926 RepID=UPI0021761EDB|nr:probable ADP-ribosylation factor GTPase-activating protein AGD14 [Potentilla anserina]